MGDRVTLSVEDAVEHRIADGFGGAVEAYIMRAAVELQHKVEEAVLALPPGTLLCVHGFEALEGESDLDSTRFKVRVRTHALAVPDGHCPAGSGSRTVYTSPWPCRGCGQRRTIVQGRACETCLNRFRRETLTIPPDGPG